MRTQPAFPTPRTGRLALLAFLLACPTFRADGGAERLTSRPRPAAPAVKPLAVGTEVRTGTGQRRRAVLPDGSVMYLNEGTTLKVTAGRRLKLSAGEVAVEVAPGGAG